MLIYMMVGLLRLKDLEVSVQSEGSRRQRFQHRDGDLGKLVVWKATLPLSRTDPNILRN
jgi:hypothetical protein